MAEPIKITISFMVEDKPTGGGNQFLRSLMGYFVKNHYYTEDVCDADVVLFNSHQNIKNVAHLKWKHPNCLFVHRIDGPIRLYNGFQDRRDSVAYTAMDQIADGTIFQSEWSKKKNIELGIPITQFNATITNAPDSEIFNRSGRKSRQLSSKIRLIATSWSHNWEKGFDVYQWLDNTLDFSKYEMIFVGNSPITFKNIRHIPPISSLELAEELRKSDIFITASRLEACSNSLVEALHCGLPAIGPNHSSNPDIIGKGGEVFDHIEDIPALIDKIVQNYKEYQENIKQPCLEEIGKAYYDAIHVIYDELQKGAYVPKRLTLKGYIRVMWSLLTWKYHEKLLRSKTLFRDRIISLSR